MSVVDGDGASHRCRRPRPATSMPTSSCSPPARRARWPASSAPCATPTSRTGWRSAPTSRARATPIRHIEACLTVKDEHGTWVPGYGWMFPCGDGTVNIGVGALSTMKGFKKLNLNTLLDSYRALVRDTWGIGPNLDRPRAWRLPMSAVRRHGPGWVADRRRRRPDQPDERRGHRLRARVGRAGRRPVPRRPGSAPRRVRPADRRALRRLPAHRPPVRVPDRSPAADAHRPADRGRHRGDRRHHAAGDGQPRRLVDARSRWR